MEFNTEDLFGKHSSITTTLITKSRNWRLFTKDIKVASLISLAWAQKEIP
jgi:hypothetical protein